MLQPRVALPVGAACVAVLAAGLPSVATPKHGDDHRDDKSANDPGTSGRSATASTGAIEQLSVENVSDFVAVRARHAGAYWDGRTDVKIGLDGQRSYPYRVSVPRGDGKATLSRSGGRDWKCSDARTSANDASTETLVVIPRSCFESSGERARAKASSYSDGHKLSTASQGNVSRTAKPNVVVIMSDDMRDDELDGPWMQQTRRWIGDAGVRFQNSFAPLPLCAPARASFLTGQYPHNHGVWSHKPPYGFGVFHDKETLPVWLRRGGYSTFMLGKYINGYGKPY
ncbi:MAG: sulfatase-like hydrolase/transferase, partial [Nocardioidaceae bacterium]